MLRFATIGTNFITDRFLEAAQKVEGLVHEAVYSRQRESGERFARKYGVEKCYTSLQEMAEDPQIEAVYIASPNAFHFEQAVLMMEHGKHVLCEKPAASNLRELEKMRETAQKNHVIFLEAMRSVYGPGLDEIENHLAELGTIRKVQFSFCQYSSRYDKFKNGIIENAFNPQLSNGALMDIGVYCVHPLVRLFGRPEVVEGHSIFLENGVDGAGVVLAGYPGMQAVLNYSKITDSPSGGEIQGEEGIMWIDRIEDTRKILIQKRNGEKKEILIEKEKNNMYYEVYTWKELVESADEKRADEAYVKYSAMELEFMDLARKKMGIRFPADSIGE